MVGIGKKQAFDHSGRESEPQITSPFCILRDLTNDTLVKHPYTACITPPNMAEVRLSGACWRANGHLTGLRQ